MTLKLLQPFDIVARVDLANSTGSILQVVAPTLGNPGGTTLVPLKWITPADIADGLQQIQTRRICARYYHSAPCMTVGTLQPDGVVALNEAIQPQTPPVGT